MKVFLKAEQHKQVKQKAVFRRYDWAKKVKCINKEIFKIFTILMIILICCLFQIGKLKF